ncbi:maleylpyruvate isomerase family mycothiol-dependent enzyme [Actinoplanes bogorensis]|uniref:Maleylpyruvate isomerase family mycothiol-dependent enzyme n=1 Tax=Paractinoplanes bogorensis TaxID=1610840 RepID=A0ABS5YSD7_9ACTN|nr:maleylpyruvate isomerase family mycothiol-dependent enzyme [Actinoplanes bogorensis]MBU2665643.1 maleylpyruvate isomerase family mycothiol-dependent enzyme [Actinoplanes bogorensis]
MDWLTPQRYATELEAGAARLGAAATALDPAAIVPTCPEWTVRDLVTHVGTGHRYATEVIAAGRRIEYQRIEAPSSSDAWTPWLLEGARTLNAAVHERGFTGKTWTWQPRFPTAGFWLRRMVHDQLIHCFDADPSGTVAPGTAAPELAAPDLAADGVADLLTTFEMFDRFAGTGETLRFRAIDIPRSWHVTLTPGGVAWTEADTPADVTVTAPAPTLLLALNRRLPSPDLIEGDTELWERWREASRF